MLARLKQLFERTISQQELCSSTGGPLRTLEGSTLGYLDVIQVVGNRLVIQGWSTAKSVTLHLGNEQTKITPSIHRSDLAEVASDHGVALGFASTLPYQDSPFTIELAAGQRHYSFERKTPSRLSLRRSKYRYIPAFLFKLIQASPHIGIWYLWRTAERRKKIKQILGLALRSSRRELSFATSIPRYPSIKTPVTVILPVFNAFDVLKECLERVLNNTDCPWRMVIVEDCSTDKRVRPFLRTWCNADHETEPGRIKLITNTRNLGFIRSVNRALAFAREESGPVILLNSDALVPPNWASRLLSPMMVDPSIASVTPMSNDAELSSVPVICRPKKFEPGEADELDAYAQTLPPGTTSFDPPTGVGFCMAMNRRFLDMIPEFDTEFGRGYGEEVDWCQKTRALGGRHIIQPRLFVEHRSGSSFGPSTKRALLEHNNSKIAQRYHGYDMDVQHYISEDPSRTTRLALGIFHAGQCKNCEIPVYLAHSWGGGADLYLKDKIKLATRNQRATIVLRVGGSFRWQLEFHTELGVTQGGCNDIETIERLLAPLKNMRLIYSCGVGDSAPQQLPEILLRLAKSCPIDVLFHDYFPLTPAYHLLDEKHRYNGVPDLIRENDAKLDEDVMPLSSWRAEWSKLFQHSQNLITFSTSSAQLVAAALPEFTTKISTQPHRLHQPVQRLAPKATLDGTIGILGNINAHKGAEVAIGLAQKSQEDRNRKVVLIGSLDPTYSAPKGLRVHGEYDLTELHILAKRYRISCWVIPSIWPETFSYTTHEALATGLPVFVFNLGAQAEAAAQAKNGHIVPLGTPETRVDDLYKMIEAVVKSPAHNVA